MATVRKGAKEEAQVGSTLLVIHNFAARSGDELALSKGDRIELIERDDDFEQEFLTRSLAILIDREFTNSDAVLSKVRRSLFFLSRRREV